MPRGTWRRQGPLVGVPLFGRAGIETARRGFSLSEAPMRETKPKKKAVRLGDLIEAALAEARQLGADPRRAASLAADAVTRILLESGERKLVERLAAS